MNATLLIVDDDAAIRRMLRLGFEQGGDRVLEARTAAEALEMVGQDVVDLVISDLKMPGQDGLFLARQLLEQDPNRPVILMTGYASLGSAREAVSLGVFSYFTKPLDVHQVGHTAKKALEHRRLVLENLAYQRDLERRAARSKADPEPGKDHEDSVVDQLARDLKREVLDPLSVALGRIDMAMGGPGLDESRRNWLQMAREQIERAVGTVKTLGEGSRREAF